MSNHDAVGSALRARVHADYADPANNLTGLLISTCRSGCSITIIVIARHRHHKKGRQLCHHLNL